MRVAILLWVLVLSVGCRPSEAVPVTAPGEDRLSIAGYTTVREVYGQEILPGFRRLWKKRTGREVVFEESYLGSGAQSRAIVSGFMADVAALSLEPDVTRLVDAKLVSPDWKDGPTRGVVTQSLVVVAVRPGNPRKIRDWPDLALPQTNVLTPDPRTSGGAMWNVAALLGSALTADAGVSGELLLEGVLRNVEVMDKGARESLITFEKGIGDAAITYENEVLTARLAGRQLDWVVPRATILIENPVAIVEAYARKQGRLEIAKAFVEYLVSEEAQRAFAKFGYRPARAGAVREGAPLPEPERLFTIRDLGGWPAVQQRVFGKGGTFDQAMLRARSR